MDIDTGTGMSMLGHHPGDKGHAQYEELVCDTCGDDRPESGIAQDYLAVVICCGIAFKESLDVGLDIFPDLKHCSQKTCIVC